jgi:hypothetical protein
MHPPQAYIFYFHSTLQVELCPSEQANNQSSSKQAKLQNLYMCFDVIIQRSAIFFLSKNSNHLLNTSLLLPYSQQTIIAL